LANNANVADPNIQAHTTFLLFFHAFNTLTELDHADYERAYGTSEATPGIAALVLAYQEYHRLVYSILPSSALVTAILLTHAIPPSDVVDASLTPILNINITDHCGSRSTLFH
jgi:hypothetical protein